MKLLFRPDSIKPMRFIRNKKAWEFLKTGDIVDVVAPGFRCSESELEGAAEFLTSLGLKPRIPKGLFKGRTLFSNSDEYRCSHLARALKAPDSKAVWCVRGGYGSLRLLPKMKRLTPPKQAKVFLGYSDITSVHLFLNQFWNWPTLHAPVLDRFGGGRGKNVELKDLKDILFGRRLKMEFSGLKPLNEAAKRRRGVISSRVLGGNLAVLQSSLGTPFQIKLKNQILFLEDIGERPHRLDRMLTQLTQANVLRGAKAIVFGDFVLGDPTEKRKLWSEVVHRFAKEQSFPIYRGLKAGHGPIQRTIPLNTTAKLKCGTEGKLVIETGGA